MQLITTTEQLKTTTEQLAQTDFVTVDSEFIRESTFWPQLCLIQMASPDREYLIDPLAEGLDLEPFFTLMRNENVVKVFHSARQDIEIIYHLGSVIPAPLFDSQIAAMVLGFGDSVAYDHLVQHICGQEIDKSSRFTDWSLRPLSEKQLHYALADVTWLRNIYLHLNQELQKSGRAEWLKEEMDLLTAPQTYENPPDQAWLKIKSRLRNAQDLAVLRQLAAWREVEAQNRNVPRRRILRDETLVEIAQQKPTSYSALTKLRSLPKNREAGDFTSSLLAAVQSGLEMPMSETTSVKFSKRLSEGQHEAVDILKLLLKIIARKNAVAAKMLASSTDLEQIVLYGADARVAAMQGWRYELYGKTALEALDGQIAIGFKNGSIALSEP